MKKTYTLEVIVRGFEYFAKSRSFCKLLRNDYELPSISTLTRLTSNVPRIKGSSFARSVFQSLNDGQKKSVLLIDKVCVKPLLSHHVEQLFGNSISDNTQFAKAVLAFMIVWLYGEPKFLVKMLPISKLNINFLNDQDKILIDQINNSGSNLFAIICNNNHVNQANVFKKVSMYFTLQNRGQSISTF